MNRGVYLLALLITLIMLSSAAPPRSRAGGEEIDSEAGPSGLIDYLWWNVVPSHRKFYSDFQFPAGQKHLTGGLDGFRSRLSDMGIVPTITYVTDTAGNPFGGDRQSVTYCDNIGLNIDFDLQKLVGMPGAKINMSGSWRNGTSLSNDYIGNIFNVQQVFGGQTYKLVDLYFQQSLALVLGFQLAINL